MKIGRSRSVGSLIARVNEIQVELAVRYDFGDSRGGVEVFEIGPREVGSSIESDARLAVERRNSKVDGLVDFRSKRVIGEMGWDPRIGAATPWVVEGSGVDAFIFDAEDTGMIAIYR